MRVHRSPVIFSFAPDQQQLPQVLPTDRLFASGKARPQISSTLRQVPNRRNTVAVASVFAQIVGPWLAVGWFSGPGWLAPLVWIAVVLWGGRCLSLLFLLNHEAAHSLLFSRRRLNDGVGRWVLSPVALVDFDGYRRAHIVHHKDELGPNEPDMGLYAGYPSGYRRFLRRLWRDGSGQSAAKQLRGLARGNRAVIARVAMAQVAVAAVAALATGHWWAYVVVWFLPWATVWQVINRLRSIAEHAGMEAGADRRVNTHVVRQRWLSGQWLVPFQAGFHLAHHVDTSIPWTQLHPFHTELVEAGWISADLTYGSYPQLWRYLVTAEPAGRPPGDTIS
ncbi:MAG: fatty acid desaturase [Acidimicrobiales bacterium]|jgi:fatty acid desaturase